MSDLLKKEVSPFAVVAGLSLLLLWYVYSSRSANASTVNALANGSGGTTPEDRHNAYESAVENNTDRSQAKVTLPPNYSSEQNTIDKYSAYLERWGRDPLTDFKGQLIQATTSDNAGHIIADHYRIPFLPSLNWQKNLIQAELAFWKEHRLIDHPTWWPRLLPQSDEAAAAPWIYTYYTSRSGTYTENDAFLHAGERNWYPTSAKFSGSLT